MLPTKQRRILSPTRLAFLSSLLQLIADNLLVLYEMAPNLRSEDYYEILGCPRNADDAALKKAYRKLAVKVS